MRNLLGKASIAQCLDGERLKGRLLSPLQGMYCGPIPLARGWPVRVVGNEGDYCKSGPGNYAPGRIQLLRWFLRLLGGVIRRLLHVGLAERDGAHADVLRFITAVGDIHQREG